MLPSAAPAFRRVAVYGAGLMGSGVAQVAAAAGFPVTLVDVSQPALERATARIRKSLKDSPSCEATMSRISTLAAAAEETSFTPGSSSSSSSQQQLPLLQPPPPPADADLIIECIVENLKAKHELFAGFERALQAQGGQRGQHGLPTYATNTSSLSVAAIACGFAAPAMRARVAGLHFFNPVPAMKLVEIVEAATPEATTAADVGSRLDAFARALGKVPVRSRDTPGFIVNRLLVPYISGAITLYAEGVASKEDIDVAMRLGAGYPMGPLELADLVGLDTLCHILEAWGGGEGLAVPAPLRELVDQGHYGRKTGRGFHDYAKKEKGKY